MVGQGGANPIDWSFFFTFQHSEFPLTMGNDCSSQSLNIFVWLTTNQGTAFSSRQMNRLGNLLIAGKCHHVWADTGSLIKFWSYECYRNVWRASTDFSFSPMCLSLSPRSLHRPAKSSPGSTSVQVSKKGTGLFSDPKGKEQASLCKQD